MFSLLRRLFASSPRACRPRSFRPRLEALEDRLVPALALRLTGSQVILPLSQQGAYASGTGSANAVDDNQGFNFNGNNFTGTGGFQQSYSFKQGNSNLIVFNPNSNTGGKTVAVTDISSANLLAAQVASNIYDSAASGLQMVKTYSFAPNSSDVLVTVRLTNNSTSTTYNQVNYQDNADVGDPTHDLSTVANTFFMDHMASGQVYPNQNINSTPFNLVMSLASNDPRAHATVVYVNNPIRNDPFLGVTAPVLASGTAPDPAAPNNYGVGLSFNVGNIAPGQTAVFQYCIAGSTSVQAATDQFQQEGSHGGCGLTRLATGYYNVYRPLRYSYNAKTRTYNGNITLTNISSAAFGPNLQNDITIVMRNMPKGVTVANPTGFTASGAPYITISGSALTPSGTVRFPISLRNPKNVPLSTTYFNYPIEVWSGAFDPRAV